MEGIEKFLQGRYGFDGLACGLVFLSLIINLVTFLVPVPVLHRWNFLCFVPLVFCVLRMFSRSTEKRSRENERFLRIFASFFALFDSENKEKEDEEDRGKDGRVDKKEQAQLFRFFKCPACSQRIRVPRGKGKVEITCPKCGNRFIKKT